MGVKNIIKKELSRVFTDKKLVISLFILPGVLIMVIYSIMGGLISKLEEDIDTHIPIVYIQNAPEDFKHTIDSIEYIGEIDYLSSSDSTEPVKDGF